MCAHMSVDQAGNTSSDRLVEVTCGPNTTHIILFQGKWKIGGIVLFQNKSENWKNNIIQGKPEN